MDQIEPMSSPAKWTAGVDEVGRGPLVGDVVAAAVVLPRDYDLPELTDSKKLSETQRQRLALAIEHQAIAWSIGRASPQEIDQLNIHHATLLAMRRAVERLSIPVSAVVVDGRFCPDLPCPCQAIIKGDLTVPAISAASILAKVARDRDMYDLDQRYPQYGFAQHKGYPTPQHLTKIQSLPILVHYRKSFKPVALALRAKEMP